MKVGDLVRSKTSGFLAIVLEVTDRHISFVYASGQYLGDYDLCSKHRERGVDHPLGTDIPNPFCYPSGAPSDPACCLEVVNESR